MTINEANERRIQTVNSAKSTVSGIFDLVYNYGYAIGYGDKQPTIDGPSLRKPELLINSKNSLLNLIDSVCAMGYNLGIAVDNAVNADGSTYQDGYDVGYQAGNTAGRTAGYSSGKTDGRVEGMAANSQSAYNSGYTIGYNAGKADINHDASYNEGYNNGMADTSARIPALLDASYRKGVSDTSAKIPALLDASYNDGYETGYEAGLDNGNNTGYQNGYAEGLSKGLADGREDGYADGVADTSARIPALLDASYQSGYNAGNQAGYQSGYNQGRSDTSANIPALLDASYNAGYDAGYQSGAQSGNQSGYQAGYDAGYSQGRSDTSANIPALLDASYNAGYNQGRSDTSANIPALLDASYNAGYQSGAADVSATIPSLLDASYQEGYDAGYAAGQGEDPSVEPDPDPSVEPDPDPSVEPIPDPSPVNPVDPTEFEGLLDEFNAVLDTLDITQVSESETPTVYSYLSEGFNEAYAEWNNDDSDLFKETTYPEIPEAAEISMYRGSNKSYEKHAYNAMQSWLMAMSLSELVPSNTVDGITNNQTELFKKAYEYADGIDIPLYGGYDLHADPTIARLAAGAVYAKIRGSKSYDDMDGMREELDYQNPLGEAEYECDLNFCTGATDFTSVEDGISSLGYLVNMKTFLPGPFGPIGYVYDGSENPSASGVNVYSNRPTVDFPYSVNNEGLFATSGEAWEIYNYNVDIDYDGAIVDNYQFYDQANGWNQPDTSDERERMQRMIEATALGYCTNPAFYATKKFEYADTLTTCSYWNADEGRTVTLVDNAGNNIIKCLFTETTNPTSNTVYEYKGPFSDLFNVLATEGTVYDGGYWQNGVGVQLYDDTDNMKFINIMMSIADDSRLPIMAAKETKMEDGWGRTRPQDYRVRSGQDENGYSTYTFSPRSASQQSPLNGIDCCSIAALMAGSAHGDNDGVDKFRGEKMDDYPSNAKKPKSYPSGHNTQVWMLAMYFGQMQAGNGHPEKIVDYMKKAYRFGVNRAVSRAHWLSDIIYGRLFATMILPIMNAMESDFIQYGYNHVKDDISTGSFSSWERSFPDDGGWDADIYVYNNSGTDFYTDAPGRIRIYLEGHLGVNFYIGAQTYIAQGENYWHLQGVGNGIMLNSAIYQGMGFETITDNVISNARIYSEDGWNCGDWSPEGNGMPRVTMRVNTSDPRCSQSLTRYGATYVLTLDPR